MALDLQLESFAHAGEPPLFEPFACRLEVGQAVALVGGSGSGKSTLLHLLAGLHPQPLGGRFEGRVSHDQGTLEHPATAYLGSEPDRFLTGFCQTVREEVGWSLFLQGWELEAVLERVEETLQALSLENLANLDPRELSGGQRQLVALAAVWARRPSYLLLDEPSTHLDPLVRKRLRERVLKLVKEGAIGVVWASSDLGQVGWCDQVWSLEGKTVRVYPAPDFDSAPSLAVRGWPQQWALRQNLKLPPWSSTVAPPGIRFKAVERPSGDLEKVLKVQDLDYSLQPGQALFEGFTCELHRGERVALVGPNGAGKTTLGRLMRGLLRPQRGTITSGSQRLSSLPVWQTAETVSYTFQDPGKLFARERVDDELLYSGELLGWEEARARKKVEEALRLFGLQECREVHPRELSACPQALLALALAWLGGAALQIFDEPLARLDRRGRQILDAALKDWEASGTALVFIDHDLDWLSTVCHRFVVLDHGRLVCDGPAESVFSDPHVRRILGAPLPFVEGVNLDRWRP